MKRPLILTICLLVPTLAQAQKIGFVEDFALAKDRTKALAQLIPGTEDYYFYHCLHHQNLQQYDRVEELLVPWIKRYKYTNRVRLIMNRQALLTYPQNSRKSLDYLIRQLRLTYNHQRETLDGKTNLPSKLDNRVISREVLTARALGRRSTLQGFEDRALDWLIARPLDANRRRNLLQRLRRPDYPNLVKLVLADLAYRNSRGFGSLAIHRSLTLAQLEECITGNSALINQSAFVQTYLSKLRPSDDVDWRNDPNEEKAYYERLWAFARRLAPVHNSLKVNVLFHRLQFNMGQGVYDKKLFMEYIRLPRRAGYVNPKYLARPEHRNRIATLGGNYQKYTLLPAVSNDEPLVRAYLHKFFIEEAGYKAYQDYILDTYLKRQFAETKIVNGLGDAERWYSLLTPATYKQLRERVDLDFAATNASRFGISDIVKLQVDVKNVPKLIVKVYEINTQNYYRETKSEVNTNINLDGLVPNIERSFTYQEAPLRRVRRDFEFAELKKPGIYVIDFIGNGKSSRALIRKGRLQYTSREGSAGHVFTVLDENKKHLKKAAIWMSGKVYTADEDGYVTIPFSNAPSRQPIILSHGEQHTLTYFQHSAEKYVLSAGIFVDRESLLARQKALAVFRPSLRLNGNPVTLSVLEDVQLHIRSVDLDGVTTTKRVKDFKLHEDRESTFEFQVPARLASIAFSLQAKVKNLSQNKKVAVAASRSFHINGIDKTARVEGLHLARIAGRYVIKLLGRNGEVRVSRPIQVVLKHRDFRNLIKLSLQTDARGRVDLGLLDGIDLIQASGPDKMIRSWLTDRDRHTYRSIVHAREGNAVTIPVMFTGELSRRKVSLFELRNNVFVADAFRHVSLADGLLRLTGLRAGDYDLLLKESNTRIRIRVGKATLVGDYLVGDYRQLEQRQQKPLQISKVSTAKKSLQIQLQNATKFTRVHILSTRMAPDHKVFDEFSGISDIEPFLTITPGWRSLFASGRNIGDEYRYIIERRYAAKFPGNMLERPQILLNPWAIRKTATGQQTAAKGNNFRPNKPAADSRSIRGSGSGGPRGRARNGVANLEFFLRPAVQRYNASPDKNGLVTVPLEALGDGQHIQIVATDPNDVVLRNISLPEREFMLRELRLTNGLDAKKRFSQQKQISVLNANQGLDIIDITSARFEVYDSFPKVFQLYTSLSGNSQLREFSFLTRWNKMKDTEKRELYSKYACHELHFFLYHKDAKFFQQVVRPFIAHKKDKTFLDHWLLDHDLATFLSPWSYRRLNSVEKILLGRRIKDERARTERFVREQYELIPPNVDLFNRLFNTAVKGNALEAGEAQGVSGAMRSRSRESRRAVAGGMAAPGGGGGGMGGGFGGGGMGGRRGGAARPSAARPANQPRSAAGGKLDAQKKALAKSLRSMDEKAKSSKESLGRGFFSADRGRRKSPQQLFRKLDSTKEWVENNYYKLPIESQNEALVKVNAFWRDYAKHGGDQPFRSSSLAESGRGFTEMMLALAVLDLPFEAKKHKTDFAGQTMKMVAASPLVAYHEQLLPAPKIAEQASILVSQNFYRNGDRYKMVNGEKLDKFVSEEFLVHTVYGCQVVVTNPTSARQKLGVLLQVPTGSMPVAGGKNTRTVNIDLQPYRTQTIDYFFYFPGPGEFAHYPVSVAKEETSLASAKPQKFKVVRRLSKIDRTSWAYVSQFGSDEDVLNYLNANNLQQVPLSKIAFRMKDAKFFASVIDLLSKRHIYDHTLWSYALRHNHVAGIRELLQHSNSFVSQCGPIIDSPLLTADPVVRKTYQHMEYRPLVNARAHQLGDRRRILNDRFNAQYHRLMNILSYRRALDGADQLAVVYYLLLQDRIGEALERFKTIDSADLQTTLQYDYFAAYLDFFTDKPGKARAITARYRDYPVDRWRKAFANIANQLDEIGGKDTKVADAENRDQVQSRLAASQPSFDFNVEALKLNIDYRNLDEVQVNYYLMDIELLFSRNPFVQQFSSQFSHIRPNMTQKIKLPKGKKRAVFEMPKRFQTSNLLVEIVGQGTTKSQAYYANSLTVQMIENYGQVRVALRNSSRGLPKVYVKVYARMKNGQIRFFKDGYTDLRGRFDYASLSTNELDQVARFAVLILSEKHGAVVREAAPPKR